MFPGHGGASLWSADGVGVIGGAPKVGKTWLALDIAVSVATGTPALGCFPVSQPGPVLLYGAEDAPADLRARLAAIAAARGLGLGDLDLGLIVAPTLRLDAARDRARLRATLDRYRPRPLLLDPLVRLHRIDENSAGEMSAVLGELRARSSARTSSLSSSSTTCANTPGPAARTARRCAARGTCTLGAIATSISAAATANSSSASSTARRPCRSPAGSSSRPTRRRISGSSLPSPRLIYRPRPTSPTRSSLPLATAPAPLSRDDLRAALRTRNATRGDALIRLRAAGRIERCAGGFRLRPPAPSAIPVPAPTAPRERNAAS